jgi:glycerate kinase
MPIQQLHTGDFIMGQPVPLRILVAPDSFKGSLAAHAVAAHISAGLLRALPQAHITQAPIADGGEGTAQVVADRLGGAWQTAQVTDANGDNVAFPFAVCSSAAMPQFAVFDAAAIVGLPDATVAPALRTTRGVGQAIRAIAAQGYATIVVGLGGSSTNDGGAGMLSELTLAFTDAEGNAFHPVLATLPAIRQVQAREDTGWMNGITLIGLTDVTSPLAGPGGASQVFGAQKGIADLDAADRCVAAFAAQVAACTQEDCASLPGAGAAGGLGYAVRVAGGVLQPGAAFILDALGLQADAMPFDWIITGEGRSDAQTLLDKGPAIVAGRGRACGIPVTLLSGAVEQDIALFERFDGCFSVQSAPVTLAYAMQHAAPLLEAAAFNLGKMFAARAIVDPASLPPVVRA